MKVAIVGGGICGLYLSWKLAERGAKVTVFEKNKKIGKEACSGLFSQRILNFIPQSHDLIQKRIKYAFIHFPKRTVRISFSKEFFVMKHDELDRMVALLAEEAGVKIVLNEKIDALPEGFDKIIGCDGAISKVRKLLNLKDLDCRLGIQGIALRGNSLSSEEKKSYRDIDFVDAWPTKSGFFWKIPREKDIEYGIIEKQQKAKGLFDKFIKERDLHLTEIKAALISEGLATPADRDIALCGDAAGLTKPWTGGGVIWALTAADILLAEYPSFLEYKKELEKFFSFKIMLSKLATKVVYFIGFKLPFLLPKSAKIESDFLI